MNTASQPLGARTSPSWLIRCGKPEAVRRDLRTKTGSRPLMNCGRAEKVYPNDRAPLPYAGRLLGRPATDADGPTPAGPTAAGTSPSQPGADPRSTRRSGGARGTLPRSAGQPDPGGFHLSARARPGLAVAPAKPGPHRRRPDPSRRAAKLGPQHTGFSDLSGPRQTAEPGHHLDHQSWKRVSESAGRRDGRRAAHAAQGAASRETLLDASANRDHRQRQRATRNHDPARQSAGDLPAQLRSCLLLGPTALLSLRELVLPSVRRGRLL